MNIGDRGWVVSLWIDASQIQSNDRNGMPYLSWSPYDRVTIDEVADFSDFFQAKDFAEWDGTVQRLHLIPIKKCTWRLNENCLISDSDSEKTPYGLYCIVTARFKYRFKDVDYVEERVWDIISDCLQGKKIQWQGFRSLGAEDFVGIFLANSIADLSEAVALVRQITFTAGSEKGELFNSAYSFMGFNIPDFCQAPDADLLVRLHCKMSHTGEEVREQLEADFKRRFKDIDSEINFRYTQSGKGCVEVTIPNHINVLSCFHNDKNAVFNGQSDFYKEYVESSRTYWYISGDCDRDVDRDIGEAETCEENENPKADFRNYKVHPVSRFILKEYERMINSHRCLWWKPILQRQYMMYTAFVKEYTDDGNQISLCQLNNKIQTALLHINQATAPIYEIPYHNYYYSGSYNDVLRMYYGVIAAIFNLAYDLPREENTNQHEIVYCVDFEESTKVHSSMYTLKSNSKRFVIFHLPYDAFMKFGKTVKLLLHEAFHYVAPYNRAVRNRAFVKECIINVFKQYILYLEDNGLTKENEVNIVEYFYEEYGGICDIIEKQLDGVLDQEILNGFTEKRRLYRLRHIPEKICEVICNKLEREVNLWLKEVEQYCSYETVYKVFFDVRNDGIFLENIRTVALASKEAFCDTYMINVLSLSLEDYIMLLYNDLFEDYDYNTANSRLDELVRRKKIEINSFDFRIGMVVDNYYYKILGDVSVKEYRDNFRNSLYKMESLEEDKKKKAFYQYLDRVYDQYLESYAGERIAFKEFFTGYEQWLDSFEEKKEETDKLKKAATIQTKIFESFSVIHDFIDIEIDQDLLNGNKIKSKETKNQSFKYEWNTDQTIICSLGDYVEECYRIVQMWGDDVVWYRGVCSDSFSLLPSLFRNLDPNVSLYANQAKFLHAAYYETISDITLWTEQLKTVLEHMSFLQHYGMPTSLLDFSEDMFMALHFALNPDVSEDRKKVDTYVYQPKVVMFSPARYNKAIISMQKGRLSEESADISPILLDLKEDLVKEYCVYDMSQEYINSHIIKHTKDYNPNPRDTKYPRPIAIRRANARIQVQKGTFLAYNLSAEPEREGKEESEYYSYLDLKRIQEDYYKMFYNSIPQESAEFIKEIYVNKQDVPTIKKQLKAMNITTARAYPELFRTFAEYMEKYREKDKH